MEEHLSDIPRYPSFEELLVEGLRSNKTCVDSLQKLVRVLSDDLYIMRRQLVMLEEKVKNLETKVGKMYE